MESRMIKILTIDDNQDNLMILKTLILESFPDISVLSALDGQRGLELAAREEPDIILLDIIMPGMDGYEVCRKLKEDVHLRDIPVVFVTAIRSNKESRIRALDSGAEAFLTKPIDDIELTAQIRAMLKIRAANIRNRDEKQLLATMVEEKTKELKAANTELKQSKERFQLLFNKAPLGYQSLDIDGRFVEVNQQWIDMLGYTRDEVIGKWFGDFLCPEYVEGFRKRFPIFKKQGFIHSEFEMFTKDANRLFISFEGKIACDSNGNFQQTHCILQDITDQRKAETALKESEERYKYLFEYSGVGIGYYTTDGIVISYNQKALENIGGKREDYIGKSIYTLFPNQESEIYFERIQTALSSDTPQVYEDYLSLNSNPRWFSSTFTRVAGASGQITGVQIASLDITDRKTSELELRETLKQNQRILDNLQDAYFQADLQGNFTMVNTIALSMYGYDSVDEILGQPATSLYADPEERQQMVALLKKDGRLRDYITRGLRKDGTSFPVSMNIQFVKNDNGEVTGTEGVVRDITERIQAEEMTRLLTERLSLATRAAKLGIWDWDVVNDELIWDDGMYRLYNISRDSFTGAYDAWSRHIHPEDKVQAEQDIQDALNGKTEYAPEFRIIWPDGSVHFLQASALTFRDSNGKPTRMVGINYDITTLRVAEKDLRENEIRFRSFVEQSPIAIGVFNLEGLGSYANQKFIETLGLTSSEEFVGRPAYSYFAPRFIEESKERTQRRSLGLPTPSEYEAIAVHPDGSEFPVHLAIAPIKLPNGIVSIAFLSDITEQKQSAAAALANSFKFQSLFNEMTSGSAIYEVLNNGASGADYIIKDFNKAALKAEGKEKWEVLGKSLHDLRPNIDQYGLIPVFQRVWQTGQPAYYPSTIYVDEKFSNWYENHVYKLLSGEIVAIFDDVTEKKRAEEGIQHLAYHDYLTDAYNRRFFEIEYNSKNTDEYYPLAIVMGDLNGLKLINDSFGHYSGDSAIQQFANEIKEHIPDDAILARVGGDEFSVILIRSSEEEARLLTAELQSNIRFNIKDSKGNTLDAELTATFGYSCQSFHGQGLDDLAKEAETFMYRRKFLESASKRSNVVDAIMSALFEKSEREQKHSLRVSSIASAIATAMGLHETAVAKVRVAGALHDIGKIGIDESILEKAEQLSSQEWELIKQHPIRSARILASVDEYLDIVPIVKAHHERADGSGYPVGLSEKQIPLEAKIIAVADSFDAMTVKRPYQDAISKELAAEELKRCAGSQFDQEVVDVFIRKVLPTVDSFVTKAKGNH